MWMQDGRNGFLHGTKWIVFHGHLNYPQKAPLGGRPNTKLAYHGTPNAHTRWFILLSHVWGPTWIEIHWNCIWLRVRSHMTSQYTWGSATTLHDFGGGLGMAFGHFFWALTIWWSRLLARVWSGPHYPMRGRFTRGYLVDEYVVMELLVSPSQHELFIYPQPHSVHWI